MATPKTDINNTYSLLFIRFQTFEIKNAAATGLKQFQIGNKQAVFFRSDFMLNGLPVAPTIVNQLIALT